MGTIREKFSVFSELVQMLYRERDERREKFSRTENKSAHGIGLT
jgi:hypothetical protein